MQIRNPAHESALRSLPSDERFPLSNWFKQQLLEGSFQLTLNSESMRKACPPLKKGGFLPDGSNLPHVVASLSRDMTGMGAWLEHLRTILPLKRVDVVESPDTKFSHLVAHFDNGAAVPSWHLSDGTLRMFALTLLPYLKENSSVFFIEEPENGIHPQAVEAVFLSLNSVYDGQVLVATHSPIFVGLCEPHHLLCFSKTEQGETDVLNGSQHPKLQDWKKGLPLARLYAAGILS
ncbi:ATP-binding protein [Verrucomicrobium sp. BvORR106]|uniref:AAA family ATPase n=1 Tax=Verrucomicrobium sp. BvORR106 TaxID=1403819 RepID=UPI002240EF33|nr:ATP-binding protein [Verrucomicrobium sp. BvORR106]